MLHTVSMRQINVPHVLCLPAAAEHKPVKFILARNKHIRTGASLVQHHRNSSLAAMNESNIAHELHPLSLAVPIEDQFIGSHLWRALRSFRSHGLSSAARPPAVYKSVNGSMGGCTSQFSSSVSTRLISVASGRVWHYFALNSKGTVRT